MTISEPLFEHIHPSNRHLATASHDLRLRAINTDCWVDYPAAAGAIKQLFKIVDMPRRTRMPSVLFWASPNMGKTSIQERFVQLFDDRAAENPAVDWPGVLRLEANDELTEKRLYHDILGALGVPTPTTTASRLQAMVIKHLDHRRIRLIIIDEIQRITDLADRQQRVVMNALKFLSNKLSLGYAGFGSGESRVLVQSDPHLMQRFNIIELPRWQRKERWAVQTVSDRIAFFPLRRPTVVDREFMETLMHQSDTLIGRMFELLQEAATLALDGEERLTPELVEATSREFRQAGRGKR
jgi:hypothetical protein